MCGLSNDVNLSLIIHCLRRAAQARQKRDQLPLYAIHVASCFFFKSPHRIGSRSSPAPAEAVCSSRPIDFLVEMDLWTSSGFTH